MKSLLLVDSRIMLLDCMYAELQHQHHRHRYCVRASLITDDEAGGREGGDEVVISVQQDHVARPHVPRHAWLQHRHHLHGYCARASLTTDDERGGREWVIKSLLLVVRRIMLLDCMYPLMRGSNIGTTFTGKVHLHLSKLMMKGMG